MLIANMVITLCSFVMCLYCVVILIKCNNTHRQRDKIISAITEWIDDLIDKNDERVDHRFIKDTFDSMESFDETLFRIWDWGYKNIVPKDLFEEIVEYMEVNNNERLS